MSTRFKLLNTVSELKDGRNVEVIASTDGVDRMGDIIIQSGIQLDAYKKNPVVLWGHDSDQPIARATDIGIVGGKLRASVEFPAEGTSAKADEIYRLIKAKVVNATSVGFIPLEAEAIDPMEPWSGFKFTKSELLEFSFVSVPANKDCLIVGRSIFTTEKSPMMDPVDCPYGDCPMKEGKSVNGMTRERMQRLVAMPLKFRELAKALPHNAKGARGQLLRCANMLAKEISGESAVEVLPTPNLDDARRRLQELRQKIA